MRARIKNDIEWTDSASNSTADKKEQRNNGKIKQDEIRVKNLMIWIWNEERISRGEKAKIYKGREIPSALLYAYGNSNLKYGFA
ncbi:hypothetical protein BCIN_14g04410 [Botrytis cinerea B05.10]|uniref:Uncharacterized protein n=2 Tax=Botryotinia fuckeliana TaxID=40559 RepID=A0A384K367_BOTFB|nr:hypothetical protein BCIN_14g04410 [Botrytis cinerea B05.10]ATZ57286.1 hypothetical protein BCIN_14g04410 [Botrytis cinerea B05.10]CCD49989.1 predicted protein [Botrytis cinerea T4]